MSFGSFFEYFVFYVLGRAFEKFTHNGVTREARRQSMESIRAHNDISSSLRSYICMYAAH